MKDRTLRILKALIGGYVITFIMLLLLSFLLYKFNISSHIINIGIIITYALSCFLGGLFLASKESSRKILWGLLFGVIYFIVLTMASILVNKGFHIQSGDAIKSLITCVIASLVGGFASP